MPFILVVLAIAVGVAYLGGGRLRRLAHAPLRSVWLLLVAVALQFGVDVAAGRGLLADASTPGWLLLLASQLLVVAWVLRNAHLPGMFLVATGLALNAAVMAANGAMPVSPDALAAAGAGADVVPTGKHTLLDADTRLPWLADIWALPLLRSIISVGDVVMAAGLLPVTHALMTHEPPEVRRRRGAGGSAAGDAGGGMRADEAQQGDASGTRGHGDQLAGPDAD